MTSEALTGGLRREYHAAVCGPWHDIRGHLPFLRETAAGYANPVIIEAGVRTGMSTRAFLLAADEACGQLWSVDIAPPQVPGIIRGHPRWHFLQAGDLTDEARSWLPAVADVLFLDAHDDYWMPAELYAHVLAELRAYAPRVRPGGIVLLHDTQWQPPGTDLGAPAGTIARVVGDWCAETGLAWENRPGFYGLGVVRIPAGDRDGRQ